MLIENGERLVLVDSIRSLFNMQCLKWQANASHQRQTKGYAFGLSDCMRLLGDNLLFSVDWRIRPGVNTK
jgi:hypothetical protein